MSTTAELTNNILIAIPREFPGSRVWRSNVVAMKADKRFVRAGIPGQADISGILAPSGRRIEIEVKRGDDDLSDKQEAFGKAMLKAGGIYLIATDSAAAARLRKKWAGVFVVARGDSGVVEELRWMAQGVLGRPSAEVPGWRKAGIELAHYNCPACGKPPMGAWQGSTPGGSLDLDASIAATLASDSEPWTMPECSNPDCPVGCPDSHCAPWEEVL